jgi:SAM-dependent methyltransferase
MKLDINLLKCTKCENSQLYIDENNIKCNNCGYEYRVFNHVPIFIDGFVEQKSINHVSNQIPHYVKNYLKELNGVSLNIGAGSTLEKIDGCIELEYSIWKNTDIVSDAHSLPFKDNTFDAVVSFNTFEHLSNPELAAKEIFRVLKPGAKLILQTAFLQPLHESPYHFYNATKYGLLNWFKEFDIDRCEVSENFNPSYTISWLCYEILQSVNKNFSDDIVKKFSQISISDLSEFWLNSDKRNSVISEVLFNLPKNDQEKFSAGFELIAFKKFNDTDKKDMNFI